MMVSANYVDDLELRIKELSKQVEHYKEIARQYTELAARGIYYTLDEIKAHDAEIKSKAARDGYMKCAKDFDLDRSGVYLNGWSTQQLADFYENQVYHQTKGNENA